MRACLDTPAADEVVDPTSLLLEGWAVGPSPFSQLSSVEVWSEGSLVGTTRHWFARNDVTASLVLPDAIKPGFAIGMFPPDTSRTPQSIELRFFSGSQQVGSIERTLHFSHAPPLPPHPAGATQRHPSHASLHRLIARTLTSPPGRIVELGCGRGDVGRFLCHAGISWHGIEWRTAECDILAATGLPFTRPTGHHTSYRNGGFEFALVTDPDPNLLELWLPELRRLASRGILLNGAQGKDSKRLECAKILSQHLLHCESLPYRSDLALRPGADSAAYDRWFLMATDWA